MTLYRLVRAVPTSRTNKFILPAVEWRGAVKGSEGLERIDLKLLLLLATLLLTSQEWPSLYTD